MSSILQFFQSPLVMFFLPVLTGISYLVEIVLVVLYFLETPYL